MFKSAVNNNVIGSLMGLAFFGLNNRMNFCHQFHREFFHIPPDSDYIENETKEEDFNKQCYRGPVGAMI